MRDVLTTTSTDYENRIKGFDQQIETMEAGLARIRKERDETIAAKKLLDDQIAKLPQSKPPKAAPAV
jgi:phage shock protein A